MRSSNSLLNRLGGTDVVRASRRGGSHDGDSGSVLILVLVAMVVMSLTVTGLLTLTLQGLKTSQALKNDRSVQYEAQGAADLSIQYIRYNPDYYSTPGGTCTPTGGAVTIGGTQFSVACVGTDIATDATRTINLSVTCVVGTGVCFSDTPAPIVTVEVIFDDYANNDTIACSTSPRTLGSCGTGMTVQDWVVQ